MYSLNMLEFLRKNDRVKQLGLMVESSDPEQVNVDVVRLVKMPLNVRCVDEYNNHVNAAITDPAKIEMYVPEDWRGDKLTARGQLTRREIEQARYSPIEKTPFIELAAGQITTAARNVKIKMPSELDLLSAYNITAARLGIILSDNLQGKYDVQIKNLEEVLSAVAIRATPDAKRLYENMRYHVILEIDDEDIKSAELRRELVYNFPPEYIRTGEISLNQQPRTARFALVPLPSQ